MREHKNLWIFITAYAIVTLTLFLWMDINISNGYQRSISGAYLSEYAKSPSEWTIDIGTIQSHFTEGYRHYEIFSGIADWPPLQLILLTLSFFIFGVNKFAYTVVPLIITLATLVYVYFLVLLTYEKTKESKYSKNVALLAVSFCALSTFFFFEAAAPMLENGLALFTLASIYHFARWLRSDERKQFYLFCLVLGLGLLWKLTMVLALPSFAVAYLLKKNWKKELSSPKTYKLFAIGLIIVLAVLSPLFIRDAALKSQNLDQTGERNVGRLGILLPQDGEYNGVVNAWDFEFALQLPDEKLELVFNRYDLSYFQKFWVMATSLFLNSILLPLLLLGMYFGWKKSKNSQLSEVEIMLGVFLLINIIFYSMFGLLPRYMIPATVVVAIFSAVGLVTLGAQYRKTAILMTVITILLLLATTALFFKGIYKNDHVQAMQHDYKETAKYLLEHGEGEHTIITTREYEMTFQLIAQDDEKQVFVESIPDNVAKLKQMLNGEFAKPEGLEGSSIEYDANLPRAQFVVVHEGLEYGAARGYGNFSEKYNAREFMDTFQGVVEVKEIPSSFPNARTWVYKLGDATQ